FVSTALCSPSRASVLTGQYAHTHGVVDNNTLVPEDTIFFPQYLQAIGYQTAFFGKWHMGSSSDEPRKGFDKWVSFRGQGVYFDPTLNVDGERVEEEGHISDILTDYALRWMEEERDPDKPFFLFLSHKAVHARFMPPERYQGKYEDVEVSYPESMANTEQNYWNKPAWVERQRDSWHGVDYMYHGALDFDTFYKRYCETVLSIDDSIGRVLDHLDDTNLSEETLTMYMGDNGFLFGEHGLIDKRCMYEPSIRVPMLAYAPGMIEPGTVISEQVMNIDIAPTVLEMAGLEAPDHMHGRSFVPLLQGNSVDWRDEIFYEYYWEWNFPQTPTVFGVRTDRYKYMFYHGIWDIAELYDIQNDPDEMHNLIHVPEHEDLIADLNQRMWNWLEETDGMNLPLRPNRGNQQGLELKY
ncbi:MAG: sulfatase-like hydrolase/transferase, partial [Candidatus Marinimicrobia bacterium]|nr:sulfatase-like hydrolase/transferase [Candidatus Neomarinimicrobiota bacterium]